MVYWTQHYVIDWEKVQTLDDIKRLLTAMEISFEPNSPHIASVEDLLRLEYKPAVRFTISDSIPCEAKP